MEMSTNVLLRASRDFGKQENIFAVGNTKVEIICIGKYAETILAI